MRERPLSIMPIAVLHFVFGGLGILCGICLGIQLAGGQNWMTPTPSGPQSGSATEMKQLQDEMQKAMESAAGSQAVQIGTVVADLAISIIMIVSGIGLLQLRPWGRSLSILYAILSIALKIFEAVYAFAVTGPLINEFINTHTATGPEQQFMFTVMKMVAIIPPIIQLVCMIYPIVVLIIMLRPAVVAAFRDGGSATTVSRPSDEQPENLSER
ncbi:MAG TPA: hypothetical protein VGX70_13295 [Gemmataceae bacterium]|jgi:hypothetical protein|nr:hypothetical protein [Gemmataceae bacterium]